MPALALTDPDGLPVCLVEAPQPGAAGTETACQAAARAAEGAASMVQLESGCSARMEALAAAAPMEE